MHTNLKSSIDALPDCTCTPSGSHCHPDMLAVKHKLLCVSCVFFVLLLEKEKKEKKSFFLEFGHVTLGGVGQAVLSSGTHFVPSDPKDPPL